MIDLATQGSLTVVSTFLPFFFRLHRKKNRVKRRNDLPPESFRVFRGKIATQNFRRTDRSWNFRRKHMKSTTQLSPSRRNNFFDMTHFRTVLEAPSVKFLPPSDRRANEDGGKWRTFRKSFAARRYATCHRETAIMVIARHSCSVGGTF